MVDLKSQWLKESALPAKYNFISIRGHGQLQIQVSEHNIMPFISGLMPYLKIHKSDQHKLKCYFANCSAESCASLVCLNKFLTVFSKHEYELVAK